MSKSSCHGERGARRGRGTCIHHRRLALLAQLVVGRAEELAWERRSPAAPRTRADAAETPPRRFRDAAETLRREGTECLVFVCLCVAPACRQHLSSTRDGEAEERLQQVGRGEQGKEARREAVDGTRVELGELEDRVQPSEDGARKERRQRGGARRDGRRLTEVLPFDAEVHRAERDGREVEQPRYIGGFGAQSSPVDRWDKSDD